MPKVTPKFTKQQIERIKKLDALLAAKGFDEYSRAGIIGNGLLESGLDPDSITKSGSYSGLWQNSKGIRKAIEDLYGNYSLENQLRYLDDWVSGSSWIRKGKHRDYTAMGSGSFKRKGYKSAEEASDAFMKLYERPVILDKNGRVIGYQSHGARRSYANQVYNLLYGNQVPTEVQPQPIVEQPDNTRVVTTIPEEYIIPAALKDVWDAFEQGAVAIGKKKSDELLASSSMPAISMLPEYTYPTLLTLKNGKQPDYYSIMERVAKENNPKWNNLRRRDGDRELSEDEDLLRILNDNTYNYRGYYSKNPSSAANADTHWDDEFKTVYHPTFSVYSRYSGKKSQYNPEGLLGGQWNGELYIPAWGQKIKFKNGKLPGFKDGVEYNISLPEVVITPDKNLVKRVRKTWPNPAVRKLALKEIERFKRFSEREPYDDPRFDFSWLDYFPWTSSHNVRIDNRSELPANYEVERAMQIVNESGNPDAYIFTGETPGIAGKDRSYYRNENINSGFNGFVDAVGSKLGIKYFQRKRRGIHISPNDYERDPYFSELSHAYLYNNGLNSYGKKMNTAKTLNNSAYKDPNDIENQAHGIILPLIYSYLRGEMPIRALKDKAKDAIIARRQGYVDYGYSIPFDTQISQKYEPFLTYKNGRLPRYGDGYKYSWNSDNLSWDRYTGDAMGDVFADFVVTPRGGARKKDVEPVQIVTPEQQQYSQRNKPMVSTNSTWHYTPAASTFVRCDW